MSRSLTLTLTSCLLLAFLSLAAYSQTATATLSGTVDDPNGASLPGVVVTVENVGTRIKRTVTTNESGGYTVPLLPPGEYTVMFARQGFTQVQVSKVVLNVADQKAMNIVLRVGDVNAAIEVRPDENLIRTDGGVGTTIDRTFVGNLPLNGRSFQSLIKLAPGVVLTKATSGFNEGQFSVNGQRADANYFTVDGVSANIGASSNIVPGQAAGGSLPGLSALGGTNNLVSVDALQEFRIQTSTYAPEYGRSPGGQISIVTRGGTNQLSGTLFEYFRNDALDANDWFANRSGLGKAALRQNQFGAVLGGPVVIPRFGEDGSEPLYDGHDHTFFFFSYEGLRLRLPQVATTALPNVSARQAAVAGTRPFLNAFPIPNGPNLGDGFAQFSASYSDPSSLNATSIRIDHNIGSKLTIFGRYNYAPSETITRDKSSLNQLSHIKSKTTTLTVGATLSITPNFINEFRANWSRSFGTQLFNVDNFGGAVPPSSNLFPAPFTTQDSQFLFEFDGGAGYRIGVNADNLQRQINLIDNLSIVSGSHQLKFGVDYRRLMPVIEPVNYFQGVTFDSVDGAVAGTTEYALVYSSGEPRLPIYSNFSAYGQDTWKASQRLTLTYGLRWELNPSPSEKTGNLPFAVIGLYNPATMTLASKGTPLWKTTYTNFAPRIGIAYQLSEHHGRETILRGGLGIFYDLGTAQAGNAFGYNFPFLSTKFLFGANFPLTSADATPPAFSLTPPIPSILVSDPNLKLPRVYQWNITVEQSLGPNQTVSASYVAALGRKLLRTERIINPNPNFTTVDATVNSATSDYHAMQLQYTRRLSHGLQALASYTWSHSIDTASDDFSPNVPGGKIDPSLERGPSDFDVRQAFSAALTYNIPSPGKSGVGKVIFNNWAVDTTFIARTALPINVFRSRNIGFGTFAFRPDLITNVPLYLEDTSVPGGKRLNPAAFVLPVGRQGTLGRNALRGFPAWQMDLSLRRQFRLKERTNLQFRADFFNIFNHPNFADPITSLSNPLFGRSTQMLGRSLGGLSPLYQIGGPRSIQLALKLQF